MAPAKKKPAVASKAAAAKKAAAKKATPVKKPAAARRSTPKADTGVEINVITPDDQDWNPTLGRRNGRKDLVSPVLTPLLDTMMKKKTTEFQLNDRDPFTIYQVRGWANRLRDNEELPDGVAKIKVTGGSQNNDDEMRNIHCKIIFED